MIAAILALQLVAITGPAGNLIEINPDLVTSLRDAHYPQDGFPRNVRCLIFMVDSKIVGAQENCDLIKGWLQAR